MTCFAETVMSASEQWGCCIQVLGGSASFVGMDGQILEPLHHIADDSKGDNCRSCHHCTWSLSCAELFMTLCWHNFLNAQWRNGLQDCIENRRPPPCIRDIALLFQLFSRSVWPEHLLFGPLERRPTTFFVPMKWLLANCFNSLLKKSNYLYDAWWHDLCVYLQVWEILLLLAAILPYAASWSIA